MVYLSVHPRTDLTCKIDHHNGSNWIRLSVGEVEITIFGASDAQEADPENTRPTIKTLARDLCNAFDGLWEKVHADMHDADESNAVAMSPDILPMPPRHDEIPF